MNRFRVSGQTHQSSSSNSQLHNIPYHTTVNGPLQPQRDSSTLQGLVLQAYKAAILRPYGKTGKPNTIQRTLSTISKETQITYPRYTQRPNQRIQSAPNPTKKPKDPKIIPQPSQYPNFFHVKGGLPHHISHQAAHRSPSKAQSVVIVGVLLRRTTVLIRMGLLGLSLQGTISSHVCQPSRTTLIGANAAGTALIDVHVPSSHRRSGSPCGGAERNLHVHRTTLPGSRGGFAYLTRFCVHSRSRFVSRAVFRPSEKFARAPFSRRCARACSSRSSCCFAFNCPDLCM